MNGSYKVLCPQCGHSHEVVVTPAGVFVEAAKVVPAPPVVMDGRPREFNPAPDLAPVVKGLEPLIGPGARTPVAEAIKERAAGIRENVMQNRVCPHCHKVFKNAAGRGGHERICPERPKAHRGRKKR